MPAETLIEGRSHTSTYEPLPQAARAVRALLARLLPEWGLPGLADDAALVATELVTNAIRSRRPVRLTTYATAGALHIEVFDTSPDLPERRGPGPYDEDGRGLLLVAACADDWGHRPADGGKVVWATLTAGPARAGG